MGYRRPKYRQHFALQHPCPWKSDGARTAVCDGIIASGFGVEGRWRGGNPPRPGRERRHIAPTPPGQPPGKSTSSSRWHDSAVPSNGQRFRAMLAIFAAMFPSPPAARGGLILLCGSCTPGCSLFSASSSRPPRCRLPIRRRWWGDPCRYATASVWLPAGPASPVRYRRIPRRRRCRRRPPPAACGR